MSALQAEKNKIFDYLKAKGPKAIKKTLDDIHPSVRNEAKELKNILKESNTKFGNLLTNSKKQSYQDLGDLIIFIFSICLLCLSLRILLTPGIPLRDASYCNSTPSFPSSSILVSPKSCEIISQAGYERLYSLLKSKLAILSNFI